MSQISQFFARQNLDRLMAELSPGFQRLATELVEMLDAESKARVADVHQRLFSANSPQSANAALSRLIVTINRAAVATRTPMRCVVTREKKGGAQKRWVWFEGDAGAAVSPVTSELNAIPTGELVTNQLAVPLEVPVVVLLTFNEHEASAVLRHFQPAGLPESRTVDGMTYNELGMHGGMRVVHRVSKPGQAEAQSAANDAIHAWRPRAIIAVGIAFGASPQDQRIGDVLISEYVRGYELTRVNADGTFTPRGEKQRASACLYQRALHLSQRQKADPNPRTHWPALHFGTVLSGDKLVDNLTYRQALLRLEPEAIGGEMEGVGLHVAADRHRVDWLVVKAICDWADGDKRSSNTVADQQTAANNAALVVKRMLDLGNLYNPGGSTASLRLPLTSQMRLADLGAIPTTHQLHDVLGRPTTLKKDSVDEFERDHAQAVEVLPYLMEWIDDPAAPPLSALLGEYGMGKTITSQQIARDLESRRTKDPTRPIPLYFDLRHLTGLDKRVPSLRETLEECMRRGWLDDGKRPDYSLESVFAWIRHGAVIIIDGLDEVLVKLTEADGQAFTNGLIKLLTDTINVPGATQGRPLKMLISCRTQYFRTLRDQQNHFTGEERGQYGPQSYRAVVLLPFSQDRWLRYLRAAVPDILPERLLDVVHSVHNLGELTQRPYTLRLVGEFIREIEEDRLAGRPVSAVSLYRRMVRRWLERDSGKHHIRPDHKLRLAGHLAAHLWRSGSHLLTAATLESWFHEWLEEHPDIARRYSGLHPDQLEEDLRTATFLSREDSGGRSAFHFAHTSLQEFFLAEYLLSAVETDQSHAWAMRRPSTETVDFLGQMLAESNTPGVIQTLRRWCKAYEPLRSELLFAYVLRAHEKGWPAPGVHGINLAGARLRGWHIGGSTIRLDLGAADFSGADLREASFKKVRMRRASFCDAKLDRVTMIECQIDLGDFSKARLAGAVLRRCELEGTTWTDAALYRTQFMLCTPGSAIPNRPGRLPLHAAPVLRAPDPALPVTLATRCRLRAEPDIPDSLDACRFSPDGSRLAACAADNVARLWDTRSGELVLTLQHERGLILDCAMSPDGQRLAVTNVNGTIQVWDALRGYALHTYRIGRRWTRTCAFSPDGQRLLCGSDDGALREFDAVGGDGVRTLRGHRGWVICCEYSRDGLRLVSCARDGTIRVWDAADASERLVLTGHSGSVNACTFSPDGLRVASVGDDGTVRVWDSINGESLVVIKAHADRVLSCAFSPDARYLASVSWDDKAHIFDTESWDRIGTLGGPQRWADRCVFSTNGRHLAVVGRHGLRIWDVVDNERVLSLPARRNAVGSCGFAARGNRIVSRTEDGEIRIWDASNGRTMLALQGDAGYSGVCALSPDGRRLVSCGDSGVLLLRDLSNGRMQKLVGHGDRVRTCAFSADGRSLLSASDDRTMRVWDAVTGAPLHVVDTEKRYFFECQFSTDGRWLVSSSAEDLCIWDAQTYEALTVIEAPSAFSCALSPDRKLLASAGVDGALRLWNPRTGAPLRTFRGHGGELRCCAFSLDGRRLAAGGENGVVRVRDVASEKTLLHVLADRYLVNTCEFSPDGEQLLTGGSDGTLRLWDIDTGRCVRAHTLAGAAGHAVWVPSEGRIIEASGEAWRWLRWHFVDDTGTATWLPVESFGLIDALR